MSREWKPGDVANILSEGEQRAFRTTKGWVFIDGSTAPADADEYAPRSPLVVVDPESILPGWGKLISSLLEAAAEIVAESAAPREVHETTLLLNLARAFDAALDSARLTEPTDPKALVTDRRENIWRLLADGEWVCTSGPDIGEYLTWDKLVSERGPLEVES